MRSLPLKIAACVLVVVCVALGLVGLILPIVPGLLFLALAALIAARSFPAVRSLLGRNRAVGRHLDRADRFLDLPTYTQLKVGGLVCLRAVLDAAALLGTALTKLLGLAAGRYRYPR